MNNKDSIKSHIDFIQNFLVQKKDMESFLYLKKIKENISENKTSEFDQKKEEKITREQRLISLMSRLVAIEYEYKDFPDDFLTFVHTILCGIYTERGSSMQEYIEDCQKSLKNIKEHD